MSEKPRPQPSAATPSAKPAAKGAPPKPKPAEEAFDFLAPPQGPGELGRLAHYRVVKVLGRGGMGIVFQAEDTRLNRTVGLKVMLPTLAKKQVAHDRFIREARATAAIEHDHIVTIYEVNEDKGVPYLSMQYLKGSTLEDFLKRGKSLNVPQIMRIGREIAKGLTAAHACRLIHRDIKPTNIWLDSTNKGRVKILDFGLARPTNAETHLTQEGMVLGSPAYMSPEQAFGHVVDERCDLFSLGCVLYRLCAGRLPFAGKDATSMLLAITSVEPTPLRELNEEVPRALADLVHQLLAKRPEDRPPSAKAVVQRIQEIEREWIVRANTLEMPTVGGALAKPRNVEATVIRSEDYDVEPVLADSAIMDLELQPSDPPDIRPPQRGRSWLVAGLGGALVAILSVFCCLGIVISSDHGFVQIVAEDDEATAFLEKAGLSVLDHHKKARNLKAGTHQLPSGGYQIDAGDLPEGIHVDPAIFALHWRDTLELKVRFKRPRPKLVAFKSDQAAKVQQEWAAYLDRPIMDTMLGDVKLVLIPPGEFEMGTPKELLRLQKKKGTQNESHLQSESPRHLVRITKPFYLGECEVTVGQFGQFVASEEYKTMPEKSKKGGTGIEKGVHVGRKPEFYWNNTGFQRSKEHPVCNITWTDAEAYCAWLSKRSQRTCRLPSEAEWEYACRAGAASLWSFSDDLKDAKPGEYMWFLSANKTPANLVTHPVARKKANPFGLFDMHGNVAEMCKDYWSAGYYESSPPDDPPGPAIVAKNPLRVARGGSFLELPFLCRSASRKPLDPSLGYVEVGFRVLCEIPLPPD
jgi:eukaryotic-like serine/threonine-protein kinase